MGIKIHDFQGNEIPLNSARIEGGDALDHARANLGVLLNKYADPIEGVREGLSLEEAEEIAREDVSLLWCEIPDTRGEQIAEAGRSIPEDPEQADRIRARLFPASEPEQYTFTYVLSDGHSSEQADAIRAHQDGFPCGDLDQALELATTLECRIDLSAENGESRGWVRPGGDYQLA